LLDKHDNKKRLKGFAKWKEMNKVWENKKERRNAVRKGKINKGRWRDKPEREEVN
jgi:hypothetical protein